MTASRNLHPANPPGVLSLVAPDRADTDEKDERFHLWRPDTVVTLCGLHLGNGLLLLVYTGELAADISQARLCSRCFARIVLA